MFRSKENSLEGKYALENVFKAVIQKMYCLK